MKKEPREKLYKIGEVAELLGVHEDTLRNWERQGLVTPERIGTRGDRRYTAEHIRQIRERGLVSDLAKKAPPTIKEYEKYSKEDLIKELQILKKRKKYGLMWEEHKEKVAERCKTEAPILERVKEKQIKDKDKNKPTNILIEGDNYHALQVLNYTHKEKIDVIYIDPPYNTGNKDFVYNDHYVDQEDSYRHSKWLSFMEKRLRLAKNLLAKEGVLFISIDNNEVAQLKMLCDEIMPNSFVTTLHVQMSTVQGQKVRAAKSGNIVKNGEYVLVYSKSGNKTIGKRVLYEPTDYDTHYSGFLIQENDYFKEVGLETVLVKKFKDELEAMGLLSKGKLPKSKIKDAYQLSSKIKNFIHENSDFIVRRHTSVPVRLTKEEEKLLDSDFVINYKKSDDREYLIAKDNKGVIVQVIQLTHKINKCHDFYETYGISTIRGDWWPGFYLDMGNVSKEGGVKFENGKKPIRLMKQLIYFVADKNATVLDFFAGSGSTGHAVLELNKTDDFNLKFILCTYNEENGNGKIVDEYCYPRLKNVIKRNGKVKGLGGSLEYFKTEFVDIENIENVSDKKKLEFTYHAGQMIALKESAFKEVAKNKFYQIFTDEKDKFVGIYFRENLEKLAEMEKKILDKKDVRLYLFSYGVNDFKKDYAEYKNVVVKDIPEPILKIYKSLNK